jgi:hypothetical protein
MWRFAQNMADVPAVKKVMTEEGVSLDANP